MFYYALKILFLPFLPSSFLVLLVAVGVGLAWRQRWHRAGLRIAAAGLALLAFCGLTPVGSALLLPLEDRIPRPALAPDQPVAGIILLGGFEDGYTSTMRHVLATNESGERLFETALLARRFPEARVIFTGGPATVVLPGIAGGDAVREYLIASGVEPQRIVTEERSRTTWENAIYTRELLRPKPGERWLLVTSAFHMPRSLGAFRQAGFAVLPWPVDYRTGGIGDLARPFSRLPDGLDRLDVAVREWAGLVIYRLSGRSNALWPAP